MLNLDKNKTYLLACSYGPDSMALFDMLLKEGYLFRVAHVNYHFREESDLEEAGLKEYCKKNNIAIDVYNNEEKVHNNLEARARKIRYDFFFSLVNKYHLEAVLIAHNLDDNIETVTMQKNHHICTKYFGIKEISYQNDVKIIRPLLNYTKRELEEYCLNNNIPFMKDKSNDDMHYERNRIRKELNERFNDEEKRFYLQVIEKENEELDSLINRLNELDLNSVMTLKELGDNDFWYAIHLLAERSSIYNLSYKNILEIRKIVYSSKPNISLKYRGFMFVKEYENVFFVNDREEINYFYVLRHPDVLDTPYFYLDFRGDTSSRNVKLEDYPLTICNAEKDMKIQIKDYEVSVRRLFIDWKMPSSLRKRWPVILDKNHQLIYIPRYQKDFVIDETSNFYVK